MPEKVISILVMLSSLLVEVDVVTRFHRIHISKKLGSKDLTLPDSIFRTATCVADCFALYLKSIDFELDSIAHISIEVVSGTNHLKRIKTWELEHWHKFLEFEFDLKEIQKVDEFDFFVEFIKSVLIGFVVDSKVKFDQIEELSERIKRDRESFRIPYKSFERKDYSLMLFLIAREGISEFYQLFLEVTRKRDNETKTYFVLEAFYDEIRSLVSRIVLKDDIVTLVPGTSDKARFYQEEFVKRGYDVPVTFDLNSRKAYVFESI